MINIPAQSGPNGAYDNDLYIGHHYEPSWDIETINRINSHMSLALHNCHIKGSESACTYLPVGESITPTKHTDGRLSKAWLESKTAGAAARIVIAAMTNWIRRWRKM
jgi:hypothetical protein